MTTVTPDNSNFFVYSTELHMMLLINREKTDDNEVFEEQLEVRLSSLPVEISTKRVLSFYVKTLNIRDKREKVLLILFDGGTLASFKIEELSDDIIAALVMLDEEM